MLPNRTIPDVVDGVSRDTVLSRKGAGVLTLTLPDLKDLCRDEFRGGAGFSTMVTDGLPSSVSKRFRAILSARNPFKVAGASVESVGVLVVRLKAFGAWAVECFGHKNMDWLLPRLSVSAKRHLWIAVAGESRPKDAASAAVGVENAAHSTETGDFVPAFPTNNGTPFFGNLFLHRETSPFGVAEPDVSASRLPSILRQTNNVATIAAL